jgi:cyclophilin family peptidyl-prolyl cis-trans isomerase/HEAT repeat protein
MDRRRGRGSALGMLAALAVLAAGCATTVPPSKPAVPAAHPAAAPSRVFASLSEAEALLTEIEDERRFDAEMLEAAAKSPDPALRARTAICMGRLGDPRGRALQVRLLNDADPSVRADAAFAAGISGDPTLTVELIPRLADRDSRTAATAAKALSQLGDWEGRDALAAALQGAASPEPRASMVQALWRWADSTSSSAAGGYATDPDSRVRAAAIYALARKPQDTALPVLTRSLEDGDPDAAAFAARGLGLLGRKESLEPLAAALESVKAPLVTNALTALEAILEKNAGATLSEARKNRVLTLAGDANPNLAVPALVLLRQFVGADREALRRVWSIATTGEGRRRQVALQSLVAALRERAKDLLDRAVESPEAGLRAAAAESLAFLPSTAAAPYRAKLAGDKEVSVRLALLSTLKTLETVRENRAFVDRCLADADSGVRAAAVEALASTDEPGVLPSIADALAKAGAERDPDIAIAALAAAEKMRIHPAARALADTASGDPRPLVARLARRALVRSFKADPASLPGPVYTGRAPVDYMALLADAKKPWLARVETARGAFVIRLLGSQAPLTVVNFLDLARKKYFDGVPIHRVVPNFVVQDGDPTGTGNGGPGYEIRDEINPVPYLRGTVGMALSGPDTGGSQWFVTHGPQPHLDGIYTVFGQVAAGQDVVDRIEQGDRILRVQVSEAP